MMRYYQELTLLPNPEVNIHFLWSKVFQQIHLGFVERQDEQGSVSIGVSFPDYIQDGKFFLLGSKLRLFAPTQAVLEGFNTHQWLARLTDYVHISSIRAVPEKISGYVICQRIQPKTGKDRLVKRYMKRHQGVTPEQALEYYHSFSDEQLSLPFIQLQSLSSAQSFRIWIKQQQTMQSIEGLFSCYGLSPTSTLPHF